MSERELIAAFFSSIRNWDYMSSKEAVTYFEQYREEMIKLLKLSENEMHDAWMKKKQMEHNQ